MRVLLLIDIQNDFLPGGALAVPDGDAVIEVANQIASEVDHVVASQDWHPASHGSFASQHGLNVGETFTLGDLPQVAWPDHCIEDSSGAELAAALDLSQINHVVRKGTDPEIDSYSAFFDNGHKRSTGLHDYLQQIGATELVVLGLATDYCVKFTVLDALELGYPTTVKLSGCRGVDLNAGDVNAAIEQMREAGAAIA